MLIYNRKINKLHAIWNVKTKLKLIYVKQCRYRRYEIFVETIGSANWNFKASAMT